MDEQQQHLIYIPDKKEGWVPGQIVAVNKENETVTVKVSSGGTEAISIKLTKDGEVDVDSISLQNVIAGQLISKADMADLPYLHEAAVLYNLKQRLMLDKPYTRVTQDILVSVNPFKWFDQIYDAMKMKEYDDNYIWSALDQGEEKKADGGDDPQSPSSKTLDPHLFEISAQAYTGLLKSSPSQECLVNQSILVSGESGAGKTESVKLLMNHLAFISRSTIDDKSSIDVVEKVLQSSHLLEAFGNAKTIHNDNSSRFSKFTLLEFERFFSKIKRRECAKLVGSITETYVLEKSRVVEHNLKERNFHIFYQLFALPDDLKMKVWKELLGKKGISFSYVGYTDTHETGDLTDADNAKRTIAALGTIGIRGTDLIVLLRAVCVVLQLGNIEFVEDPQDEDKTIVSSMDEMEKLSDVIGIPTKELVSALTFRSVKARGETFTVPLNSHDSRYSCDALAKGIYSYIFEHIVSTINGSTSTDKENLDTIGLLDIFGFESFDQNRFEQLCINYANEKVQLKYTADNFRSVKEEYEQEGIEIVSFEGLDNQEVVQDLFDGTVGLIKVLNEESVRPTATPNSFVSKFKKLNRSVKSLIQNKLALPTEFTIVHYADTLTYTADNFIIRNKDTLSDDLVNCASRSTNKVIALQATKLIDGGKTSTASVGQRGWLVASTVIGKFQSQLKTLMENIELTRTRYIRCIKPNVLKVPHRLDHVSALNQLRCAGVVTALTLARDYFPSRLALQETYELYHCLMLKQEGGKYENTLGSVKAYTDYMLGILLSSFEVKKKEIDSRAYAVGNTKVYFRGGAVQYLERKRQPLVHASAVKVQSFVRMVIAFSLRKHLLKAIISLQAFVRCAFQRKKFKAAVDASIKLQCWVRQLQAKILLHKLRVQKAALTLQAWYRGRQMKWHFVRTLLAAHKIQKWARGKSASVAFKNNMAEVVDIARRDKKLQDLTADINEVFGQAALGKLSLSTESRKLLQRSLDAVKDSRKELKSVRARAWTLQSHYLSLKDKHVRLQKNLTATEALRASSVYELQSTEKRISELEGKMFMNKQASNMRYAMISKRLSAVDEEAKAEQALSSEYYQGEIEKLMAEKDLLKQIHDTELSKIKSNYEKEKEQLIADNVTKSANLVVAQEKNEELVRKMIELAGDSEVSVTNSSSKSKNQILVDKNEDKQKDQQILELKKAFTQFEANYICPDCNGQGSNISDNPCMSCIIS